MRATVENGFRDFLDSPLPEAVYLDTSFVANALVESEYYHKQCEVFIKKLEEAQPVIVFSSILKPELWCTVVSICIRNQFGKGVSVREMVRKNPKLIRHFYSKVKNIDTNYETQYNIWTVDGWFRFKKRHPHF